MIIAVIVAAGALIGLSVGALGGGGSVLAVPVLVYGLGQSAAQATTGSLLVVGVTALVGAVTAYRAGNMLLMRGLVFGVVAIGGAAAGAQASSLVAQPVLLTAFAALLLVVAVMMAARQLRARSGQPVASLASHPDVPIVSFSPAFTCHCSRAIKVVVTATVVGLLTGFLGVGGGFLVVPALVIVLGLPMAYAAGTSLVVITITSASALVVRASTGVHPNWGLVALLTGVAVLGGWAGARLTARADTSKLQAAFTVLLLLVAGYTAWRAMPAIA
ncbi:MAG TPA: sulfite exporter TauE/SafE family protein [Streptosporangiaceae bacterium]|nr:sulfite exporter TauE/SafE family protein [Streptosporangiaceae bacterium]